MGESEKTPVFPNKNYSGISDQIDRKIPENETGIIAVDAAEHLLDDIYRDRLTGCFNRNYFEILKEKFDVSRMDRRFAVLFADVDYLKAINDTKGHSAGDEAIRALGQFLSDVFRRGDWVFRWGGDEFAIVFDISDIDCTEIENTEQLEDSLRSIFEDKFAKPPIRFTYGLAVVDCTRDRTIEDTVIVADDKLYDKKRNKR